MTSTVENDASGTPTGFVDWDLATTANGDGWNFSGKLKDSQTGNTYTSEACESSYSDNPMAVLENWTLTGHISSTKISFTLTLADWVKHAKTYHRELSADAHLTSLWLKVIIERELHRPSLHSF